MIHNVDWWFLPLCRYLRTVLRITPQHTTHNIHSIQRTHNNTHSYLRTWHMSEGQWPRETWPTIKRDLARALSKTHRQWRKITRRCLAHWWWHHLTHMLRGVKWVCLCGFILISQSMQARNCHICRLSIALTIKGTAKTWHSAVAVQFSKTRAWQIISDGTNKRPSHVMTYQREDQKFLWGVIQPHLDHWGKLSLQTISKQTSKKMLFTAHVTIG
jgi:hypothetical protein